MSETVMVNPITFEAWPKTPRLSNGGVTITEKIDGTNACVVVMPQSAAEAWGENPANHGGLAWVHDKQRSDLAYLVGAQSRTRLIFPGKKTDNAGFAGWVFDNRETLVDLLGPGRHYGEWWGQGIQRRYGMDHKVFSLFNTHKWGKIAAQRGEWSELARDICMDIVPTLYEGEYSDGEISEALDLLRQFGSFAATQWGHAGQRAEGIIIRLPGGQVFKAFVENDDVPKSQNEDR